MLSAKSINKAHMVVYNNVPQIKDVTVTYADGKEISGFVRHVGGSPGFVLCKHEADRSDDGLVNVDLTRIKSMRVTLAGGHVETFED